MDIHGLFSNSMAVPLILMVIATPLGALDVLYYHMWKFKLYKQPTAFWETITHLFRGFLFVGGAFFIINYELHGSWFWFLGAFFILDFVNEVADVLTETSSRAPLGGIPPLEYLVHIVGSTFAGAIAMSYFILAWKFQSEPTAIVSVSSNAFHPMLLVSVWIMITIGLVITLLETYLFLKHWIFESPA